MEHCLREGSTGILTQASPPTMAMTKTAVTTPRSMVYKARVDSAPLPTAAALSNHFSDRKCLEVLSGWRGCRIEQEKCSCPEESGSVASVEAESED